MSPIKYSLFILVALACFKPAFGINAANLDETYPEKPQSEEANLEKPKLEKITRQKQELEKKFGTPLPWITIYLSVKIADTPTDSTTRGMKSRTMATSRLAFGLNHYLG